LLAFVFALGFDLFPEDELRSGLMHRRIEPERRIVAISFDCPSGKNFRYFSDVALRVASVYAERVKFKQFAAVVLIEAAVATLLPRTHDVRTPVRSVSHIGPALSLT